MSIRLRIHLLLIVPIVVSGICFSALFFDFVAERFLFEFKKRGDIIIESFGRQVADDIIIEDVDNISQKLKQLLTSEDIIFGQVARVTGEILGERNKLNVGQDSASGEGPQKILLADDRWSLSKIDDMRVLVVSHQIERMHDGTVGLVRIGFALKYIDKEVSQYIYATFYGGIPLLGLVFLCSLFFSRSIVEPLSKLSTMTNRISEGDYQLDIEIERKDEIGQLADNFRKMCDVIVARDRKLSEIYQNQERLISDRTKALEAANIRLAKSLKKEKETQTTLLNASKMSALGEMAGGVAHEINSPLAVISGSAEQMIDLLHEGQADHPEVLKCAERVQKTSDRIAKIVKGLRIFSRDASNDEMEMSDLCEVIEDTLILCQEKAKNSEVNIIKEFSDDSFFVFCRATQISQVILNLLNNAYDAIRPYQDKWVKISIHEDVEDIFISITDSGKGIDPEILDKLFHPFFTTKDVNVGTGLGLSISKGIMENHSGNLTYDRKCENTRFVMSLPKAQPEIMKKRPIKTEVE